MKKLFTLMIFLLLTFYESLLLAQTTTGHQSVKTVSSKEIQKTSKKIALKDPAGKKIGYKDPKTGNLVFTKDNKDIIILRSNIVQVDEKQYKNLKAKFDNDDTTPFDDSVIPDQFKDDEPTGISGQKPSKPGVMQTPTDHVGTYNTVVDEECACVSLCWSMSEGGAECHGCCVDVGEGFCDCWEECTDIMEN
jgi:hypothetical protein